MIFAILKDALLSETPAGFLDKESRRVSVARKTRIIKEQIMQWTFFRHHTCHLMITAFVSPFLHQGLWSTRSHSQKYSSIHHSSYHEIISPTIQVLLCCLLDIFHTSSQNTSFFWELTFPSHQIHRKNTSHHHHLPGLKSWLRLVAALKRKIWIPTFLTLTGRANECLMRRRLLSWEWISSAIFRGCWKVKNLFIFPGGGGVWWSFGEDMSKISQLFWGARFGPGKRELVKGLLIDSAWHFEEPWLG